MCDELLLKLSAAGVGCYIGSTFVGAPAYADDIMLICPTPSALRLLLKICDDFACEYAVVFNADKSKLICKSYKQCKVVHLCLVRDIKGRPFHIGGRDIEQVDSVSHLGHIITSYFSYTEDIRYRRDRFVRRVNNCLWFFNKLKCNVKLKLLIPIDVVCLAANFGHLVISLLNSFHIHDGRRSMCFVLTLWHAL